jgi:hypothetical protein
MAIEINPDWIVAYFIGNTNTNYAKSTRVHLIIKYVLCSVRGCIVVAIKAGRSPDKNTAKNLNLTSSGLTITLAQQT